MDRRQTLITLLSQGYVEPSVYTQESNALDVEADQLTEERKRLICEGNGNIRAFSSAVRPKYSASFSSFSIEGALRLSFSMLLI